MQELKMDELQGVLDFFKENKVAIQITVDIDEPPTVHAIFMGKVFKTSGTTILSALDRMKYRLFL